MTRHASDGPGFQAIGWERDFRRVSSGEDEQSNRS